MEKEEEGEDETGEVMQIAGLVGRCTSLYFLGRGKNTLRNHRQRPLSDSNAKLWTSFGDILSFGGGNLHSCSCAFLYLQTGA